MAAAQGAGIPQRDLQLAPGGVKVVAAPTPIVRSVFSLVHQIVGGRAV